MSGGVDRNDMETAADPGEQITPASPVLGEAVDQHQGGGAGTGIVVEGEAHRPSSPLLWSPDGLRSGSVGVVTEDSVDLVRGRNGLLIQVDRLS